MPLPLVLYLDNGLHLLDCRPILECSTPPPPGEVDREALGRLVFSNAAARRRLNAATHLPVAVELLKQLLLSWLSLQLVVVSSGEST